MGTVVWDRHNRAEFDALAGELLDALDWSYSALREEDRQ